MFDADYLLQIIEKLTRSIYVHNLIWTELIH